jgi:hypothetical protein
MSSPGEGIAAGREERFPALLGTMLSAEQPAVAGPLGGYMKLIIVLLLLGTWIPTTTAYSQVIHEE